MSSDLAFNFLIWTARLGVFALIKFFIFLSTITSLVFQICARGFLDRKPRFASSSVTFHFFSTPRLKRTRTSVFATCFTSKIGPPNSFSYGRPQSTTIPSPRFNGLVILKSSKCWIIKPLRKEDPSATLPTWIPLWRGDLPSTSRWCWEPSKNPGDFEKNKFRVCY